MKDQLRQHPLNEGTHLLLYSIYDDILISLDLIIKNNQHQFDKIYTNNIYFTIPRSQFYH